MTKMFYFTGTGNSLYVAKKLSNELESDLVDITTLISNNVITIPDACVGLVFPLYAFGIPEIIERFLIKLNLTNSNVYFFAIITCGGSGYGIVKQQLDNILSTKNFKLSYTAFQNMPSNYIKLFKPPTAAQAQKNIANQEPHLKQLVLDVKKQVRSQISNSPLSFIYSFFYKNWRHNLKNSHQNFFVQSSCTGCGLCVKLCPEKNISLKNNLPHWQIQCQDCLACINLCPEQAIQSNYLTKIYGRYRNPFISINQLIKN